jgi:hypothetical protein
MVTTAAGPISSIEDLLSTTLATCTEFQTLCGVTTVAAAQAKIHFDALPPPDNDADSYTKVELQALRPFAIINTEPQAGFRWFVSGKGTTWTFQQHGMVTVEIETNIDSGDLCDPAEYMRKFKNTIGQIVRSEDTNNPGLVELAGVTNYLPINEVIFYGPFRGAEEERQAQGDYLAAVLDINWGFKQ